ncbi:MAG TPA: acyltransferase [Mucilaginibacter sp.]|nr:acyltransferase [Mucilaginibacter sp.]
MKKRIGSVDGWRMIAALGVLYAHTWSLLHFPSLRIGGVNLMQVIALWGNGVQLFFVISGFCFYLVLSKQATYDLDAAIGFWKKRWLRIAPAFYVACTVYAFCNYSALASNIGTRLFFNYTFLQNMVPNTEIAAHFWSLAVEWHFYLLLPFIFLLIKRLGVMGVVISILSIQIILNLFHYKGLLMPGDAWYYTIFCNIGHFAWGILIAYLFTTPTGVRFFSHPLSILAGLVVAYAGRLFFFTDFVTRMGSLGFVAQSIGPLFMSMGFAAMILSCLESRILSAIFGNKVFSALGRVSYSFYLWHFIVLQTVWDFCYKYIPRTASGVLLVMMLVLSILIPLSFLSYRLFESFYFRSRAKEKPVKKLDNATAR